MRQRQGVTHPEHLHSRGEECKLINRHGERMTDRRTEELIMSTRVLLALACLSVLLPLPARAQATPDAIEDIFTALSPETPGLAVAVARGGSVVFQRTGGAADIEQRTAVTPTTRFHVASVSKQFTAAAVLMLVRDGKVKLDAPAQLYLPSLPTVYSAVTVRQLLNHTSGLRDQWDLATASDASISDFLKQDRLRKLIEAQRSLNFPPGSEFRYSNSGYLIAAEIVTRISGVPFSRFVEQRLFRPLGMKNTLIYDDATLPIMDRAQSYSRDEAGQVRLSRLNFSNYGATSVYTTLGDLLLWSREMLAPKVLDPTIFSEMEATTKISDGSISPYGLGLNRLAVSGHDAIMHSGSDAGFRALIAVYPREDAAVVILSNGSDDVGTLQEALVDAFLGDMASVNGAPPNRAAKLAALTGYYVSTWGPGFELLLQNGRLMRRVGEGTPQNAIFHADGTIRFPAAAVRLRPKGVGVLQDNPLIGPPLSYRRVRRAVPTPAMLQAAVGDYRSTELDTTLTVRLSGGRLFISSLRSPSPKALLPGEVGAFDLPWAHVRFAKGPGGRDVAILLTMARSRDLRFDRVP